MKRAVRFLLRVILWFFGITISWVVLYRFVPVPVTFLMLQRCVEQAIDDKQEVRLLKNWESIDNISLHLQIAVVAAEDQTFLEHHGFDMEAIGKAMKYNERQKKKGRTKMRGASTISQQTAKNAFLWPGRSFVRKGFELYFTALIELLWSKQRIMEVYLNVAEFGPGIYGAEAASQYYFKKSAKRISQLQAAQLAAVLPSPLRYNAGKPGPYVQKRASWIVRQINQLGGWLDYNGTGDEKK